MRKLFILILLTGLLLSSVASAGTRLKGKNINNKSLVPIDFVAGTGEKEQIIENKFKITVLKLFTGYTGLNGVKASDSATRVYYFREHPNVMQFVDYAFGIKGMGIRIENLTDNVLIVRWNESLIRIGESESMPFIEGMLLAHATDPAKTPITVIAPKSAVKTSLYLAANIKKIYGSLTNQVEPIRDDGTTRVTVTMKVEENGDSKNYIFISPCLDFPADFLAEYKDIEKK